MVLRVSFRKPAEGAPTEGLGGAAGGGGAGVGDDPDESYSFMWLKV
jgi:hypothetical protein